MREYKIPMYPFSKYIEDIDGRKHDTLLMPDCYCPECGFKYSVSKIDGKDLLHVIESHRRDCRNSLEYELTPYDKRKKDYPRY